MTAFNILRRSRYSLLRNSPKFNLILPSLNSIFSRHFHSDDSITPKSSPESPSNDIDRVSEQNSSPQEPISEPSVREFNESEVSDNVIKSSWLPDQSVGQNEPVILDDVNPGINHSDQRIRLPGLFGEEVNTVLRGGIVPASWSFLFQMIWHLLEKLA
ncbi:uncharacterized protein LOC141613084 [Silene latifolia]|uniref:uncharacterized protein LOC141613084 n=1 Tax=Silene latifolia TaxID=37657 RepID=UPI003D7874DC